MSAGSQTKAFTTRLGATVDNRPVTIVRAIFAQPDHAWAMAQLRKVAEGLRTRLVGAILLEHDDEWAVAERRYFSAESMKLPTTPLLSTTTQELLAAIG